MSLILRNYEVNVVNQNVLISSKTSSQSVAADQIDENSTTFGVVV